MPRRSSPQRRGFTLIEVTLVIAITVMIFIAFIGSITPALRTRRFYDSTENFAEFLRSVYSSVIAVQNNGGGNSGQAIYGKLVTFGEENDVIYIYDVLGQAVSGDALSSRMSTISALDLVQATVFDPSGNIINQDRYEISHGAWLEAVDPTPGRRYDGYAFLGALLIVRSPTSGVITTYYREAPINIQRALDKSLDDNPLRTAIRRSLDDIDSAEDFKVREVDFCVASDDQPNHSTRRNIRLAANASGSSAVSILSQDERNNRCLR